MIPPTAAVAYDPVPPKIQAAMHFLQFIEGVKSGGSGIPGDMPKEGRELTNTEKEVQDSALVALLEYFNEPEKGCPVAGPARPDDGTDPSKPVLA